MGHGTMLSAVEQSDGPHGARRRSDDRVLPPADGIEASNTYGMRLLDYLDIHAYVAAKLQRELRSAFTTAGDTGEQQVRMNSTRALWDPTYTDPNFPQPNYSCESELAQSCTVPLQAPQIIPMMQRGHSGWTARLPGAEDRHRRIQLRRDRVDQRRA